MLLACCMSLLCAGLATAAQDDKVSLNFVNADIPEVVKAVSTMTGRNFLVDPRVKGTINIVSAKPVPRAMAYDILLSALRLQGFAAVESNGVTKVMPEADAKLYIGSVNKGHGSEDKLVTRVYMLKYASAQQLVNVLRPLIAPNNIVVAYPASNALVVTDYASNLKRIEQLVDTIDRQDAAEPVVIPIRHASAVDLADTINQLMQEGAARTTPSGVAIGGGTGTFFTLLADMRTNSLLVRSASPERLARVRELVRKLDTASGAPGNIHVVYLRYAEADKLAKTLSAVITGKGSSGTPSLPGRPGKASGSNALAGGIVQADTEANALIITAPQAVYNNLRAVVDKLDVRRAQVYVEALIAEVRADKVANLGVQWQSLSGAGATAGKASVIGGTNLGARAVGGNIIDAAGNLGTVSQGLNVGVVKGQITIPGLGTVLNLGALANALETDANANILSTPNLMTLDNEEAKIVIGQNVPFLTGQYAQTGSTATVTPFQTIERKDIGLTLKIKPQISEGGTVKLQIYQEVSSVDPTTINNASGPVTNKRSLESTVLVDEGQTVVLGGLIQDEVTNGVSKVPVLGSIPLLGALFRHETRQHTKTNLMVFIRPHILRSDVAALGLTRDRYEYLQAEEKGSQMSWNLVLPNVKAPQLPPLQNPPAEPAATGSRKKPAEPVKETPLPAAAASDVKATAVPEAKQPSAADDGKKSAEPVKETLLPAAAASDVKATSAPEAKQSSAADSGKKSAEPAKETPLPASAASDVQAASVPKTQQPTVAAEDKKPAEPAKKPSLPASAPAVTSS